MGNVRIRILDKADSNDLAVKLKQPMFMGPTLEIGKLLPKNFDSISKRKTQPIHYKMVDYRPYIRPKSVVIINFRPLPAAQPILEVSLLSPQVRYNK